MVFYTEQIRVEVAGDTYEDAVAIAMERVLKYLPSQVPMLRWKPAEAPDETVWAVCDVAASPSMGGNQVVAAVTFEKVRPEDYDQ